MASSIYAPLQGEGREFRLLILEPSTDSLSPLRCELERASFDDGHLRYTALSYTWGDPLTTASIIVNGVETQVTLNLEAALRNVRKASSAVVLWVDALCINQKDVAEKNHQVEMMREIYAGAELVIAWLGSASDDSDLAMQLLGKRLYTEMESEGSQHNSIQGEGMQYTGISVLYEGLRNSAEDLGTSSKPVKNMTDLPLPKHGDGDTVEDIGTFPDINGNHQDRNRTTNQRSIPLLNRSLESRDMYHRDDWSDLDREIARITSREALAITALLTRSWWSRIWVVQEVLLANRIVFKCGDAEVPGEEMRNYQKRVSIASSLSALSADCDSIDRCMSARDLLADIDVRRKNNAVDYFFRYSTRLATRPHDHIYGLFGIIPKNDQILLGAPDYGCGVEDLFINVATKLMLGHNSLELLQAAAHTSSSTGSSANIYLPSWAPDWTRPVRTGSKIDWEGITASPKPEFRFSEDSRELMLKCFEIDKIESVKPIPAFAQGKMPIWKKTPETERITNDHESPPLNGVVVALLVCFWGLQNECLDNIQGYEAVAAFCQELEDYCASLARNEAGGVKHKADYLAGFLEWVGERRDGRTDEQILGKVFIARSAYSFVKWYHEQTSADLMRFYRRYSFFRMLSAKYSMIRTAQGSFSVAYNAEAAPGDVLCVVPTCSVPLLFRKVQCSKHILIGASDAIAGMTHRELAEAVEQGDIVERRFTLV